ncbi:hypothetical protein PIROE2DRAFT_63153 [Piromyces sp. E2]|nr:hypothetical protein PIROE2DRAFT_63153 [Piromyces sp. E2]|eukprot:OUM60428.1 hypothetical protein PIROE2DRAFT_63153 [Piromyces sp. E2]
MPSHEIKKVKKDGRIMITTIDNINSKNNNDNDNDNNNDNKNENGNGNSIEKNNVDTTKNENVNNKDKNKENVNDNENTNENPEEQKIDNVNDSLNKTITEEFGKNNENTNVDTDNKEDNNEEEEEVTDDAENNNEEEEEEEVTDDTENNNNNDTTNPNPENINDNKDDEKVTDEADKDNDDDEKVTDEADKDNDDDDKDNEPKIENTYNKNTKHSIKEFFEKSKDTVVDIYITIPESDYKNMTEIAQCVDYRQARPFSTENANAYIEFNNEVVYLSKVELSLGGASSRAFQKVGYNIKTLKKGETLYGMKKFKLRGDDRDPTHMVSRLSADFIKSVDLIATSVAYSRLYINDQYMGLYTLQDMVKKNWINNYFEDKDTKNCFKCETIGFNFESFETSKYPVECKNINDDYADYTEPFDEFVKKVNNAKTAKELEEFIDVDVLLKFIAFEWIVLSWDHMLINGHNFYWYLRADGKWMPIYFDFDITWFISNRVNAVNKTLDKKNKEKFPDDDHVFWPNMSLKDWEPGHRIIDILIHQDDSRFRRVVQEMVKNYFNPTHLNDKIDHLHGILKEYVIEDLMLIKDLKASYKKVSEEMVQSSAVPPNITQTLQSIKIYNNLEAKIDSRDDNEVRKSPLIRRDDDNDNNDNGEEEKEDEENNGVDGIAGTTLSMKQRGRINLYGLDFGWTYKNYYEVIYGENYIINPRGSSRSSPLKWSIAKRFNYLCHTYGIHPETLELIEPRPERREWSSSNQYMLEATYDDNNLVRFNYPYLEKEDFMTNYCKYCEIVNEDDSGTMFGKENGETCIIHSVDCGMQKGQEMGPNGYPYCSGCDVTEIKGGVLLGKENDVICEILTDNC